MGRSRSSSRSPVSYRREKSTKERRSRSRERERRKERRRSRTPPRHRRSRSRSPRRRRSRTRSRSRERSKDVVIIKDTKSTPKLLEKPQITDADLAGKTEEEIEMIKLMGFGSFDSTKGKHVQGNDIAAVNTIHKRKYRQYMNRKGGFNRPLDFVA